MIQLVVYGAIAVAAYLGLVWLLRHGPADPKPVRRDWRGDHD